MPVVSALLWPLCLLTFLCMKYRSLGRTGWRISEISFGAWAIGGAWGRVDDQESMATLNAALDGGVNFFDTADVYGDGRSERLLAKLKKERKEEFFIATKAGRRLPVQTTEGYSRKNLTSFVNRSLKNLNTDTIDLLQLHSSLRIANWVYTHTLDCRGLTWLRGD